MLSLDQLRGMVFPAQDWVIEDLIPRGSLTGIFGREKIGKSLLMSHMAISIASDQSFLDCAATPGPVIMFPVEESLREVRARLDTLAGSHSPPVFVYPIGGEFEQDARLDRFESWSMVEEAIETTEASVAFFDPLREMHALAENDSDAMSPLLRPMRQFAHDSNTSIVFAHHASKGGGSRGSTAIAAACDQTIELVSLTEGDDPTSTRLKISVAGRYGPKRILYARLGDDLRWSLIDGPTIVESTSSRQRVLGTICASPDPLTAKQIAERLEMKLKTTQNLISELLNQNPTRIAAIGTGTTGNPRRYRDIQGQLLYDANFPVPEPRIGNREREQSESVIPDDSRNSREWPGTNGYAAPASTYWDL